MKVIWLGQAGLLIESGDKTVIVDPYLSNSVEKVEPKNHRRVPVNEDFYNIRPDILVLTHDHLDHTDPETLEVYLKRYSGITVLAPQNAWKHSRTFGNDNNYVMFNRLTEWSEGHLHFKAVYAEHSDHAAIGVIIDDGKRRLYITGDTLYNERVFKDVTEDIDVLFLPINGVGNNMNMIDAARFAKRVGARKVVPLHFGMFDELDPSDFECENKVIPELYKEIKL